MSRQAGWLCALALGLSAPLPGLAQEAPTAEELIAGERVRAGVEAALADYLAPVENAEDHLDRAIDAAEGLLQLGVEAVPYLANELEQEQPATFEFATYALGLFRTPEAEAVLRRGVERAEAADGGAARYRKSWYCWGLGMQGHVDALDLLDSGKHRSASYTIHTNMSVLESVAVQTAPASIPLLLAQLERYGRDEALGEQRRWTLRALYRVGDASLAPRVIPLLKDGSAAVRTDAARTLGNMDTPEAARALLEVLETDDALGVRRAASVALLAIGPPEVDMRRVTALLDSEVDSTVRGFLYELVMAVEGRRGVKMLQRYWGRPDWNDRNRLIDALLPEGGTKALDLLRQGLADANNTVAGSSAMGLVDLGGKEATALLRETLPGADWLLVPFVGGGLAQLEVREAAPTITARIVGATPADLQGNRHVLNTIDRLGIALVNLGYHEALPDLRAMLPQIGDDRMRSVLSSLIERLEALEANGGDRERWRAATRRPEHPVRSLAYAQLARLGGEDSARLLAASFDEVAEEEQLEILLQIGNIDAPSSVVLLERVLSAPEFDSLKKIRLRDMAAWSARRIGTDTTYTLLESSADRRGGREATVLIYAAVLGGKRALPLLERYQASRMRYLGASRGLEQERLARAMRRLRAGVPLDEFDVPPGNLGLRY